MKAFCYTTFIIAAFISIICGILSAISDKGSYGIIYMTIWTFLNIIIPTALAVLLYQLIVLNTRLRSRILWQKIFLLIGLEAIGLSIWIVLDVMVYYSSPEDPLGVMNAFSSLENFTSHIDHEFIFGAFVALVCAILIPVSMTYFSKDEAD